MSQLVALNFTQGSFAQGCPTVIAQLWQSGSATPMQFLGSLPPAPELHQLYQRWRRLYAALYVYKGWRTRSPVVRSEIEIDDDDQAVTQISEAEFHECGREVQQAIDIWLSAASFAAIDRQLRTHLSPTDEIRCIFTAVDRTLLRLPWHLWQFFEDYPQAELALSLPEYSRAAKTSTVTRSHINILAILGDQQGIDIERDRQLLAAIPNTNLKLLIQPDVEQLTEQLWQQGWDLLFFAGHSSSRGVGRIQVNPTTSLTIEQLRYGLKRAIASGLKLAIFNSCDGLGLAWDLADLQIPQVIVMREPVPDRVAQAFLKSFLIAFSNGRSLYGSVRQAREQLQALETEFPGATWLPVLCQNPAEVPQSWREWRREPQPAQSLPDREALLRGDRSLRWRFLLAGSLLVTGCLLGVRSLGLLQPAELWAFDQLLTLRPPEAPDDRFLIVTIDEADIQAQNASDRRGSLSDAAFNQALEKLESARVIGLDIYRDFAVNSNLPQLANRLRSDRRLFGVCKSAAGADDPIGIAPPLEVPSDRIGFSDFVTDEDGILRRHLLLLSPDPAASCTAPYAFNMQLVFSYLAKARISARFSADGNLQFGDLILHRLQDQTGGYQSIDTRGNQLLLNYRSRPPQTIAPSVSLTQLLNGEVSSAQIQDRIVLIGVTAVGSQDIWFTPYGNTRSQQVAGVFLQAQMASQILSAVLDRRPLLSVWPQWAEGLWIWGWTAGGMLLIRWGRSPLHQGLLMVGGLGFLTGASLLLLVQGNWVPLIPAGLGLMASGSAVVYRTSTFRR
ncbi:MAG: CHASE2 domain-containing protein [Leptolyngbyaceae cyanobacterium SL_5_14]|nr:CHASE2 domain-containing protein [Leptolyngbyaceae cyanobacterium SL_5_14]